MLEAKSVTTILREAADLIERCGLARGKRTDGKGGYCAHGALAYVSFGDPCADFYLEDHPLRGRYNEAWSAVGQHLLAKTNATLGRQQQFDRHRYYYGIGDWSNATKQEDVVRELRATADELETVA